MADGTGHRHGGRLLEAAQVDVWWMPAAGEGGADSRLLTLLDEAELARVERFRFERDRVRFVHRHAFVRRILARYLDVAPEEVAIGLTPFGRPELEPSSGLSFSVSHADELAVVAVTRECRVGIDLEHLRPVDDGLDIAAGLFSDHETARLRAATPTTRSRTFLELWTRKESLVKAIGGGLSLQLDWFSVVDEAGGWVDRPRSSSGAVPFTVAALSSPSGYVGAVAAEAARIDLRPRDLD